MALTRNGALLVVGAKNEDSAAAGNEADNKLLDAGAAYVFERK